MKKLLTFSHFCLRELSRNMGNV